MFHRAPRRLCIALAFAACALLSGCDSAVSPFAPHGPAARSISHLMMSMDILFIIITVIMWLLFGYAFYKRRGTLALHDPINDSGGEAWILIGGIAVPLIVLTVLFVVGLGLLRDFPIHGMHGGGMRHMEMVKSMKPEIEIIGHQWWWEIKYLNDDHSQEFTTANELHLPQGRPINIEVVTRDVMHSFWIPQLHGKVDLIPGMTNYIRLEATDAGNYTGQCAEYCGEEHARMRLYAVVEDEDSYQAWKQHQLAEAVQPTPDEPVAFEGQQVFLNGPCAMCHTIRGTQAGGTVAPDLTHIGSRAYIAGNSYMNNDAYLEAWVTHAQSLKPGAEMPNLTQFTGQQLRELVAYLRQLQ